MQSNGHTVKLSWGVMRDKPWHLAGVFEWSSEAEKMAHRMGPDYKVRFGEKLSDTDQFICSEPGNA